MKLRCWAVSSHNWQVLKQERNSVFSSLTPVFYPSVWSSLYKTLIRQHAYSWNTSSADRDVFTLPCLLTIANICLNFQALHCCKIIYNNIKYKTSKLYNLAHAKLIWHATEKRKDLMWLWHTPEIYKHKLVLPSPAHTATELDNESVLERFH